ncbi:hypothetical protein [Helicobacter pylori]|nr:hypothetical protein [Helicobacter pylori]
MKFVVVAIVSLAAKNTPRVTALGGLAIATIIPSFAFESTK